MAMEHTQFQSVTCSSQGGHKEAGKLGAVGTAEGQRPQAGNLGGGRTCRQQHPKPKQSAHPARAHEVGTHLTSTFLLRASEREAERRRS